MPFFHSCWHETCRTVTGSCCNNFFSFISFSVVVSYMPNANAKNKALLYSATIIAVIFLRNMQTHLHLFDRYRGYQSSSLIKSNFSDTSILFLSLKSTQTSLQTHIISEQNYNWVWNYPEVLAVCVLGRSRHSMALVHSEWLHAGPVPSQRITWIRIRSAEDILHTRRIYTFNKSFCWVGAFQCRVDEMDTKQSVGHTQAHTHTHIRH